MAKKAVIYAMHSSDNQRNESIDAQVRAMVEYAARNDLQIVHLYIDECKCTTMDNRPEFERMMSNCPKGIFEVVIIYKLNRFSKDRCESAMYKHILNRNNIQLVSVSENIVVSPESMNFETRLEGIAKYYSQNLAQPIVMGWKYYRTTM